MKKRTRIAVEIEGVLVPGFNPRAASFPGPSIPGAIEFLRQLTAMGHVILYSQAMDFFSCGAPKKYTCVLDGILSWLRAEGFEEVVEVWDPIGLPPADLYVSSRVVPCTPTEVMDGFEHRVYEATLDTVRALSGQEPKVKPCAERVS